MGRTGIFTYIYFKNQPNVGKYTSPTDPMGYISLGGLKPSFFYGFFGVQGCSVVDPLTVG